MNFATKSIVSYCNEHNVSLDCTSNPYIFNAKSNTDGQSVFFVKIIPCVDNEYGDKNNLANPNNSEICVLNLLANINSNIFILHVHL